MVTTATLVGRIERDVAAVPDPEIPVVTIADLGILRAVEATEEGVTVTITPTYSGCPAMDVIREQIELVGMEHGLPIEVKTVLAPAWTTDWMTEEGRQKLLDYGISPPEATGAPRLAICPQCRSGDVATVSEFGSTACKALMVCSACGEPFDHFKAL